MAVYKTFMNKENVLVISAWLSILLIILKFAMRLNWVQNRNTPGSHLGLKAAVELGKIRVFSGQGQDAFLSHSAVHIIVLQDDVFLQHFHRKNLISAS